MSLELLKYAQERYQSLKGKVPPASERPRTTIRPGKDKSGSMKSRSTRHHGLKHLPQNGQFRNLIGPSVNFLLPYLVPTRSYPSAVERVIGRSFVNSHFKDSSNIKRVSREQLRLNLNGKKLILKNTGKHPVEIKGVVRSKLLGFINIKQSKKWTLESGEEVSLSKPPRPSPCLTGLHFPLERTEFLSSILLERTKYPNQDSHTWTKAH